MKNILLFYYRKIGYEFFIRNILTNDTRVIRTIPLSLVECFQTQRARASSAVADIHKIKNIGFS